MADRDTADNDMMDGDLELVTSAAYDAQRDAANPAFTRLVAANAGSGKTHVLVSRVSRLLLSGVNPDRILCLTYTKAAAAEMQARLFDTLGKWSVMSDDELNTELVKLIGPDHGQNLATARGLFALALETPEGLKVQTIHAFCAQVLARFPMEAGILPGFDQIDDAAEARLKHDVKARLFHDAWYDPRSPLAANLAALARDNADRNLDDHFSWMGGKTREIELFTTREGLFEIADMLGIAPDADAETIKSSAWQALDIDVLRDFLPLLRSCKTKTEPRLAEAIESALETGITSPAKAWEDYTNAILTKEGRTDKRGLIGKNSPNPLKTFFGCKDATDTDHTDQIITTLNALRSAELLTSTRNLMGVAEHYAATYRDTKRTQRVLDFNDQIHHVHALLTHSAAADWVRYKLDGGISHILVDEAQDTSDLQWGIIDALREGFDAPDERTGTEAKTFFAVGDEKQSIYGFQGAKPTTFIRKVADEEDLSVRMGMSFRSAPDILRAVNAVFIDHGAGDRMFDGDLARIAGDSAHTAKRRDRGCVELWPIPPNPDDTLEEIPWDTRPVDSLGAAHPKEVLAATLAETIDGWLKAGERIFDRKDEVTRPMRPDDVLILVRKRDDFFDAVIRHLKGRGVPVAGADRLTLGDAVVVKDMLALARFCLFPGDDLSLAEVLKSPLFDYTDDEDLFPLAHGRDASLWQALKASTCPKDVRSATTLTAFTASVHRLAPYEFFVSALDTMVDGDSVRLRLERRLGIEARDPLTEFLGQALAYQRRSSGSLQHFVQAFESSSTEIKREPEGRTSEVRIMTVHGAKGLQAPVVILPQTTAAPNTALKNAMLQLDDDGLFVPAPSKDKTPAQLADARARAEDAERQEHLRLLYVAMTRAESRLIVCGYPHNKKIKDSDKFAHEESWYAEVKAGLDTLECEQVDDLCPSDWGPAKLYGGEPAPVPANDDAASQTSPPPLPDWIAATAPQESVSTRRVTPSHVLGHFGSDAVRSPLSRTAAEERERRFLRGNLIHKLLEVLPEVADQDRQRIAALILSKYGIPKTRHDALLEEVTTVMDSHPHVFAPGSLAEVSIAGAVGTLGNVRINAQIDRLSITPERVTIVDYKSNRPPPATPDGISAAYVAQMATYRELAREIHDRPVTCALLWTDTADYMEIPEAALDVALETIQARLTRG